MESVSITLGSATVFWQDLGLPARVKMNTRQVMELARWWGVEIEDWLKQNIHNDYHAHEAGVWFADSKDAMLFKLTWAGNAPQTE